MFTLHPSIAQHLSDMQHSTFEITAAQFHSVTEIAPLQPFLCVKRSAIRYNFRGGAEAIRYNVNIT